MTPTAPASDQPLAALERDLHAQLLLTTQRAAIVAVVAPPSRNPELETLRQRVLDRHDIPDDAVIAEVITTDPASATRLTHLNRSRDTLLREARLIWLQPTSPAAERAMRRHAPDLTSALDLHVTIPAAHDIAPWETCREQLRALMLERHAQLDFTGLLPPTSNRTALPLDALYQPLMDERPPPLPDLRHPLHAKVGCVVFAHPGAGKTTYLRHLALTYARAQHDPLHLGPLTPLLIPLADYAVMREDQSLPFKEGLEVWLRNQGVPTPPDLEPHLGEVLLLLDGLDDLKQEAARRDVLDPLLAWLRDGTLGAAIITSRSFLEPEVASAVAPLRRLELHPADPEAIGRFARAFIQLRGAPPERGDALARELTGNLLNLARTPLLLAFLVALYEREGRMPDRRIELFRRLGELVVEQRVRVRDPGARQLDHDEARRIVAELSWWLIRQSGATTDEETLLHKLTTIEARRHELAEAEQHARRLLDLLRADMALLAPQQDGRWGFLHPSLGEYFAALHALHDEGCWETLLAEPLRPSHREIALFATDWLAHNDPRSRKLTTWLDALLTHARPRGPRNDRSPSLLVGLLSDPPRLPTPRLHALVECLLSWIFGGAVAPDLSLQQDVAALLSNPAPQLRSAIASALADHLTRDRSSLTHLPQGAPHAMESLTDDPPPLVDLAQARTGELAQLYLGPILHGLPAWCDAYDLATARAACTRALRQHHGWRALLAVRWLTSPSSLTEVTPTRLLTPRLGVVPFTGRADELNDLTTWANTANPIAVRLIYGAGGSGKTRLLTHWIRDLNERNEVAFFVDPDALQHRSDSDATARDPWLQAIAAHKRAFIVIDYAELRPGLNQLLLDLQARHEAARPDEHIRVVLLARNDQDWWRAIQNAHPDLEPLLTATAPLHLRPMAPTPKQRAAEFNRAAAAFARQLNRPAPPTAPELSQPRYRHVLDLHAAALATIYGAPSPTTDPFDALLNLEGDDWIRRLSHLPPEASPRVTQEIEAILAAATLRGGISDIATFNALAERLAITDTHTEPIINLLCVIYPGTRAGLVAPMEPDRIGEALVLRVMRQTDNPVVASALEALQKHASDDEA
ncbi:MAG: hypothetical protein CMH57_15875 [Myxococcales bacterium]|nr:hypothetical protein [Myxococcales bacterium]